MQSKEKKDWWFCWKHATKEKISGGWTYIGAKKYLWMNLPYAVFPGPRPQGRTWHNCFLSICPDTHRLLLFSALVRKEHSCHEQQLMDEMHLPGVGYPHHHTHTQRKALGSQKERECPEGWAREYCAMRSFGHDEVAAVTSPQQLWHLHKTVPTVLLLWMG